VHAHVLCVISLIRTVYGSQAVPVSWLLFPDGDPCGPRSDAVTDPSLPPSRAHGTSCRSAYVTLGYR